MKKTITIILAILSIFLFSTVASALNRTSSSPKTHYGFADSAEGCAGCHVIHTAAVAKLLKTGATQTDFCYSCHRSTTTSPYDVESGTVLGADDSTITKSMAGFFGFEGKKYFDSQVGEGGLETSRHQVQTPAANATYTAAGVPGNLNTGTDWAFTSGFKCASCHDPHAGDAANDRLLRSTILGWTGAPTITQGIDFAYDANTLVTSDYATSANAAVGINEFCGLCHGKFNAPDDGAKDGFSAKFRHAMGVPVTAGSTTLPVGHADVTSAAGNNLVLCVTCHYPHGSDKAITSYNTWGTDEGTFSGSVLLRLDKRDVCYNCHGAATKNTEAYGQLAE